MVSYIKSDLEFILAQIKIAEAHAAGQPLFGPDGLVPAYNISWGLRTVDGTYNHLLPGQEKWGAADVPFPEQLGTQFRTAEPVPPGFGPPGITTYAPSNNPNSLVFDSSLRTISNLIVDQTLGNPSAILEGLQRAGADPANQLADLAAITAIYQTFKPSSDAEYQARVVLQNAEAAANVLSDGDPNTPPSPAEAAALLVVAEAAAAHALANADLEAARAVRDDAVATFGIEMDGDNVHLPNISPDLGLSASFNSWFTLFGQFFDHGLDLVNKGGSGTVFIPLQPDDPLYVEGSQTNFMVLTRATVSAGTDGVMGTSDDVRPVNTTTAYVDQNQTYSSHSSHQVFLRQYEVNADGHPVSTGKLIEGANGGMATWGEVKAQALMLGILLTDQDVGNVPLLRTDQYGNFIPNAAGYAQVITGIGADGIPNTADDVVISGTPGSPVALTAAVRTGHAFLADIAHDAVPNGLADGDIEIGLANPGNGSAVYDNELLDAHFMAGDGRVNENIGLTAVHHVFHAEHNRLVEHTKAVTLADAQAMLAGGATQADAVAFLNEWLAVDVAAVPASLAGLTWDGERLFQAAKFGTEMQYQHLVFEEFARKIQPNINVFLVPDGFDVTINPDIVAEFAHVVYRFGHSMLTETIDRFDTSFTDKDIGLIQGFLNPVAFDNGHAMLDGLAAGDIIRGMTRQVGNEIDEFVTSALRNNLLGLPLDLATINLARGRDTGVPSLNAARRDFYEATNDAAELKPYESWVDFAGNLKNEASIINFIAAYGLHPDILAETTIEGKRAVAMAIIFGTSQSIADDPNTPANEARTIEVPADAVDFLNSEGAWSSGANGVTTTGLDNVDLWIGGLAEKILPFGGMLGSTFNFVFETQMEKLQNGDRFYYLQRLDGLHLFGEMEGNSFAALIMRNTDATHLPSDVFSTPGLILEVDRTRQYNPGLGETAGADGILEDDPNTAQNEAADNLGNDPLGGSILTPLVIRNNPATVGPDTNYLRYTGDQHVVLGGTDGADIIVSSEGDDTIFGDAGNDNLEGGAGNDIINGGDGDDIIRDLGGDENIKAGAGNDVVHAGPGLDLVLGGSGQDFVVLGTDMGSEVFGGEGNDFILGNKNAERILGNEGDDWIETGTFDGAPGDNFDEIFARDSIRGNDVFLGDGGFDEFIGEGGDDIMVGSPGVGKMIGMSGFDWSIYKDNTVGTNADLLREAFDAAPIPPSNSALDVYEAVEGLSGSAFDDILLGSEDDATTMLPLAQGGSSGYLGSALDAQGIQLISGLQGVLGAGVTSFATGNIILGGDGNDLIEGRGGDDIIDGDKWLNVRISVRANIDGTGVEIDSADKMTELVVQMFNRTYNPGQLQIVREILTADGTGDIDTARFSGNLSDYTVTQLSPTSVRLVDNRGIDSTTIGDVVTNVEAFQFLDGTVSFRQLVNLAPEITTNAGNPVTLSVNENTAAATLVLDVNATDPNVGDVLAWSITGGNAQGLFTINAATGVISLAASPDYEALLALGATGQVLTVSVTDGLLTDTLQVTVNIADVQEGPVVTGPATLVASTEDMLRTITVAELTANATGVGVLSIQNLTASSGTLVTNPDGSWTLTPTLNDDTAVTLTYNIVDSTGSTPTTASLDLLGMPDLTGTGGANTLNGNGTAQQFHANGGNDDISGAGGNDIIFGDAGNDEAAGGTGNDIFVATINDNNDEYNGGADIDTYNLARTSANATINLTTGTASSTQTGNDTLVSVENVVGSRGANTITGSTADNRLEGGFGNDVINGAGGNDTLIGGFGNDTFNYAMGGGADSVDGGLGTDILNVTGSGVSETLDVVYNGTSLTQVAGGAVVGVETVNANLSTGTDTLSYAGTAAANGVTVNLGAATPTASGFASILGVENVTGGAGNDSITGTAAVNVLLGGAGTDTLTGGGADDELSGGTGVDNLFGGTGNDDFNFADGDTGLGVANRDVIRDFAAGDDIDLSAMDANTTTGGNGTFNFIGTAAFSDSNGSATLANGQVRYTQVDTDGVGGVDSTLVQGNVNNALAADFEILLQGYTGTLVAGDFIL
ncbi:MAG TPA: peroxidase family protein [Alphaproteobacteria bacterium]|jgi:Ca2+-binding RTX toxin-like protein